MTKEKEKKKEKKLHVHMTLSMVCKYMSADLKEKITPETHWVESCIEMTRDSKPYAFVVFKAYPR